MKKQNTPFARIENLTLGYGGDSVVRDVNFTINTGDIFVIMGMSGCGKSTIMRAMVGLMKPMAGCILINGSDLWGVDAQTREDIIRSFGVSYQSGALFSSMTVYENVALPLELKTHMSHNEISKRVYEKLSMVGLDEFADFYPSEISGGMIKRAALARALVTEPRALFFDEPSAGLDPVRSKQLDDLIQTINRKMNTTIIMVTHELPTIMTIATNSVYIDAQTKTVGAYGAPYEILRTTKNREIQDFLTRGEN